MKMKKLKLPEKKDKKDKNEKISIWKMILGIILIIAIFIVSIILAFALYIVIISPNFEKEELYQSEPTILLDRYGKEFARVGQANSEVVTYGEISNVAIDALVATEDSRFFQHKGIDLFRFIKASLLQILGASGAGGASTLDMQLIKQTYTQQGNYDEDQGFKKIVRKFEDVYMSVFKLEANYTKEEIVEFYLNSQWYAQSSDLINLSDGIRGIETASEYFFGKSSKDLNLAEASILIGVINAPNKFNPYNNPKNCRDRQKVVLNLMVRHGYITETERDAILSIPLKNLLVKRETSSKDNNLKVESKQAFIDYLVKDVNNKTNLNIKNGGLIIYTTFDPNVQDVLEKVENGEVFNFPNDVVQEGIAITNSEDGSIVALSGGRGYIATGTNRAVDWHKQPGSTAKPIVDYAMYIENISHSTYAMLLDDRATYSDGTSISDYDNSYKGLISMRYALEDSRNIPALLAFQAVNKLDNNLIKNYLKSVHIDYGKDLYESSAIGMGDGGVSPLDLAAAYGVFARGGYYIEPYTYTKIIDTTNNNKEITYSYTKEKVLEETTAFMINDILQGAYTGTGVTGTQIAGKTGTTNLDTETKKNNGLPNNALREVWFVTYSPSHVISLGYGYDKIYENSAADKLYLTSNLGSTARRTIMNYLAKNIHQKNMLFKVPKGLTTANVELETFPAALCSEFTPSNKCVTEYFVSGMEPTDVSTRYARLENPTNGSYTFSGNTITISWDSIKTPDAIDSNYLTNYFNTNFGNHANKYYEARLNYNRDYIGNLLYRVYLLDEFGNEIELGATNSNSFNYSIVGDVPSSGNYTFIVKSSYSIFKDNMSSGLSISTKAMDNNVGDLIN